MLERPVHKTTRTWYKKAKAEGYRPLANTKLKPWQRKMADRALEHTLTGGVGPERTVGSEASNTILRITPIVARAVEGELKRRPIAPEDAMRALHRVFEFYAEHPEAYAYNKVPEEIKEHARNIGPRTWTAVRDIVKGNFSKELPMNTPYVFSIDEARRHEAEEHISSTWHFREACDFQLHHDVAHALAEFDQYLAEMEIESNRPRPDPRRLKQLSFPEYKHRGGGGKGKNG